MAATEMLVNVRPSDNSPLGQLVLELDRITDVLLDEAAPQEASVLNLRGRAQGVVFAIQTLLCCGEDAVRQANNQRRAVRKEKR